MDAYPCVCLCGAVRALHDAAVVSDDCFVAGLSSSRREQVRKGHTYALVYVADVYEPLSSDIVTATFLLSLPPPRLLLCPLLPSVKRNGEAADGD